jgi:hypothetical protein
MTDQQHPADQAIANGAAAKAIAGQLREDDIDALYAAEHATLFKLASGKFVISDRTVTAGANRLSARRPPLIKDSGSTAYLPAYRGTDGTRPAQIWITTPTGHDVLIALGIPLSCQETG